MTVAVCPYSPAHLRVIQTGVKSKLESLFMKHAHLYGHSGLLWRTSTLILSSKHCSGQVPQFKSLSFFSPDLV